MPNPLLESTGLPRFDAIRAEHVEPAIDALLAENRKALERVTADGVEPTWESVVQPLEDADERLDRAWAPVGHLNAVRSEPEFRAAHNACLAKLSEYHSEVGQNRRLYETWRAVAENDGSLDAAQRRMLEHALRDFRLSGVDLDEPARTRFRAIQQRLSELESAFEDRVLDVTQAWSLRIGDQAVLAGLPAHTVDAARRVATEGGEDGFVLTLDFPVFHAVMTYADDRGLRERMYAAWVTRAAPGGEHDAKFDNSATMREILELRREAAVSLGFDDFAELSLASKMAPDVATVTGFLEDLVARSREAGRAEVETLAAFAREHHGLDSLEPWDVAWVAEKVRRERYDLSDEDLRPYFPAPKVVAGMFEVVERLYGIKIEGSESGNDSDPVPVWHPDVTFYEIRDADGTLRGQFWLDLYTRKGKRGGAWMGECRSRRRRGDTVETPVAWLVCNFAPPGDGRPSLLNHDEVTTLFHEFGHGLHHMLTRVDRPAVAGINGVEWDAVELPSQFMENWCWEREALSLISGHWETGEPLPDGLFEKLVASRHHLAAMDMLRQLEFALFDFRLHLDPVIDDACVARNLDWVRDHVTVVPVAPYNSYPHSFTHIFGGGYAAGYYSYKWAEVLAADAFSVFQEHGVFDRATGARFLASILERGGVRDAMEGFVEFRGREPRIDALLAQYGMAA